MGFSLFIRLQKLAEEFHVYVPDNKDLIDPSLGVNQDAICFIRRYWMLKRKCNFNKPLLTPKVEEGDLLLRQREDSMVARLKMFIHLRQDLERVRNLCYMVTKREKLRGQFHQTKMNIFLQQLKILRVEKLRADGRDYKSVITAHKQTPSIYDQPEDLVNTSRFFESLKRTEEPDDDFKTPVLVRKSSPAKTKSKQSSSSSAENPYARQTYKSFSWMLSSRRRSRDAAASPKSGVTSVSVESVATERCKSGETGSTRKKRGRPRKIVLCDDLEEKDLSEVGGDISTLDVSDAGTTRGIEVSTALVTRNAVEEEKESIANDRTISRDNRTDDRNEEDVEVDVVKEERRSITPTTDREMTLKSTREIEKSDNEESVDLRDGRESRSPPEEEDDRLKDAKSSRSVDLDSTVTASSSVRQTPQKPRSSGSGSPGRKKYANFNGSGSFRLNRYHRTSGALTRPGLHNDRRTPTTITSNGIEVSELSAETDISGNVNNSVCEESTSGDSPAKNLRLNGRQKNSPSAKANRSTPSLVVDVAGNNGPNRSGQEKSSSQKSLSRLKEYGILKIQSTLDRFVQKSTELFGKTGNKRIESNGVAHDDEQRSDGSAEKPEIVAEEDKNRTPSTSHSADDDRQNRSPAVSNSLRNDRVEITDCKTNPTVSDVGSESRKRKRADDGNSNTDGPINGVKRLHTDVTNDSIETGTISLQVRKRNGFVPAPRKYRTRQSLGTS